MNETRFGGLRQRRWPWFVAGLISALIIIIAADELGLLGGSCAQRPCTATSPCVIKGVTYTTGSMCPRAGTPCGYIGTCKTVIPFWRGSPSCDCRLLP